MWQRAMAYWQSDSVILSKPIILLFFLNSSYSCSSKNSFLWRFFWNRYFICGRCFCRCWINCWYWFQCFNQPKLFFVSTFLQKFAFKVFNAYHRWRRGLAVFSNDKVYPTIFDIFITCEWKHRDYFLSFIIWTTYNNATRINRDLIYYPNSNLNHSPNSTQAKKIYTSC